MIDIASLQKSDGSFAGDSWDEIDTRFSYCAISSLSLLGRLDAIDTEKAAAYIHSCRNFDGGYGVSPGAESHAGQSELFFAVPYHRLTEEVWTCVAALSILEEELSDQIQRIPESDVIGHFLAERQLPNGGLNGRPEKLEDVIILTSELVSG